MSRILLGLALSLLPLLLAQLLWRKLGRMARVSRRLMFVETLVSAVVAIFALEFEQLILEFTGLSVNVGKSGLSSALLAVFLLSAPLEEGLKVLLVWPLYRTRRIVNAWQGLAYAVAAGAGFSAVEAVRALYVSHTPGIDALRVLVAAPGHLFFASIWGYALGAGQRFRGRWFPLAWLGALLLHGLYEHIVWGRGPVLLITLVPLIVFMNGVAYAALHNFRFDATRTPRFSESPSLERVREVLAPSDQKVHLTWALAGSFVVLGAMLFFGAGAVYLGHSLGINFALADEADMRALGPLALLGAGLLSSFPVSGYLVARASAAQSLLEPALSAGIALASVIVLLSLLAPVGVVFAIVLAPLALGLTFGGAWIGLEN